MWLRLTDRHRKILVNMNNVVCIDSIDHNEFKSRLIYGIDFNEVVKESIEEIENLIDKEKRIERRQHEITK